MDERVIQFRVGVLVVTTVVIATLMLFVFGELQALVGATYSVHVRFSEAPGVTADTPVRKNGILIGKVLRVKLEDDHVLVTVRIQSDYQLRHNEICRINTGNLFGDPVLEFVRVDGDGDLELVRDGDYLQGQVGQDPLKVLFDLQQLVVNLQQPVDEALSSVTEASAEMGALARNFNIFLRDNGDQIGRFLQNSESALASIGKAADSFNELVGDPQLQGDLKQSIQQIPQLLEQTSNTLQGLRQMTQSAEQNLHNLERFTEPLGAAGPQIVAQVDESVQTLDAVLHELRKFGQKLNSGEGTVSKLLNDRDLYDRVTRAVENIEEVTRQMRPVMYNVRVMTDKLARNPRQLGLQGALDRRQSGLKGTSGSGWRVLSGH